MRSFICGALLALATLSVATPVEAGILYGMSGNGGANPESLFVVNTTNASLSLLGSFPLGDAGEAIAINPHTNLIYRWSGYPPLAQPVVFETINPTTLATNVITNDPLSPILEATGATWDENTQRFLVHQVSPPPISFHGVTADGQVTTLTVETGYYSKGLAFGPGSVLYGLEQFDSFDSDGVADLLRIDPATGLVLSATNITLNGSNLNAATTNGLAFDSDTGLLYAVINAGGRRLYSIDPSNANAAFIGALNQNIASLASSKPFLPLTPEPGSIALVGTAALAMGITLAMRRRARR